MPAPYLEEDTTSESSIEDARNAQSVPLLPFQSWNPGAFKETFAASSSHASPWPSRFPLPPVVRRRWVLFSVLVLTTVGCIPLLVSTRLEAYDVQRASTSHSGGINPFIPDTVDLANLPEIQTEPAQYEDSEDISEDALPLHLQPDSYLEGQAATLHFRGKYLQLSTVAEELTMSRGADSLRNDTGYMTSFLSAG